MVLHRHLLHHHHHAPPRLGLRPDRPPRDPQVAAPPPARAEPAQPRLRRLHGHRTRPALRPRAVVVAPLRHGRLLPDCPGLVRLRRGGGGRRRRGPRQGAGAEEGRVPPELAAAEHVRAERARRSGGLWHRDGAAVHHARPGHARGAARGAGRAGRPGAVVRSPTLPQTRG